MKIQSLSICVPGGCPNNCFFCVSKTRKDEYENRTEDNWEDYSRRMEFARDNGCNTLIFTGTGEPLSNIDFILNCLRENRTLPSPFKWIEIQTSGVVSPNIDFPALLGKLRKLRLTTVSLSLSSIWESDENSGFNRTPENMRFNIEYVCQEIKKANLNLRLSLNMTDFYDAGDNSRLPEAIFKRATELGANQLTFRKLYAAPSTPQGSWVEAHGAKDSYLEQIKHYIKSNGTKLEVLPFGASRYAVSGISTVLDDDCMSHIPKATAKYLILRPNCKLYTHWDKKGSLLF